MEVGKEINCFPFYIKKQQELMYGIGVYCSSLYIWVGTSVQKAKQKAKSRKDIVLSWQSRRVMPTMKSHMVMWPCQPASFVAC